MPRQTAEERRAIARQERTDKAIADFRKRIQRERSKRVYDDSSAFAATDTEPALINLYELVHSYRQTSRDLRTRIGYLQDALADTVRRLDANERTYSSAVVGGRGSDVDMLIAMRDVQREAIVRAAWTAGWYVPDVYDDRDRAKRDRLVSVDVVAVDHLGAVPSFHQVIVGDRRLMRGDVGLSDGPADGELVYPTEQAAWLAAMAYCGETLP